MSERRQRKGQICLGATSAIHNGSVQCVCLTSPSTGLPTGGCLIILADIPKMRTNERASEGHIYFCSVWVCGRTDGKGSYLMA